MTGLSEKKGLNDFGINPKIQWIDSERARGYEKADFEDAFEGYLPAPADSIRDSVTNEGELGSLIRDKHANVTDVNARATEGTSRCHAYKGEEEQHVEI